MQGFADFSDNLFGGALLVALSLAGGGVVFALAVLRPGRSGMPASALVACARLTALGAAAMAVLQVAVLLLKVAVLSELTGTGALAKFAATLQARAGLTRATLAVLLAVAALRILRAPAQRGAWLVTAALAAVVCTSSAWLVHGAGRLEHRAALMTLTVLHQVGAAVWVGGLLHLAALWRLGRHDVEVSAVWPDLVARFSQVAFASVAGVLLVALPLGVVYVGSLDGLVGTGYGSLIVAKVMLLAGALFLAARHLRAVRRYRTGGPGAALRVTLPWSLEAEVLLVLMLLFTAASLSSQPPAIDTAERATWNEVVEVFRPKWPDLRTPSVTTMMADASDPLAVGGQRTMAAYSWSNFSHNVAGLFLLAMSLLALAARSPRFRWARHWPLGLVALGVFVFLRTSANDGTWPFGRASFWDSTFGTAEGLQHRLGALVAVALGIVEWRARTNVRAGWSSYVFPILAAAGGLLLLTHSHAAFEPKESFLIQVTHTVMGTLAVLLAAGRWLELRLRSSAGRLAGTSADVAMLLIACVLIFYREANVVVPATVGSTSVELFVERLAGGGIDPDVDPLPGG